MRKVLLISLLGVVFFLISLPGEAEDVRPLLDVPFLSQKDGNWSGEHLGHSSYTIGEAGCAVTSLAMVLKYFGYDTDPSKLNASLTEIGGFDKEGNILLKKGWQAIGKITKGKVEWVDRVDANWDRIDQELDKKYLVISSVKTPSGKLHFIVFVGESEDEYHDHYFLDPLDAPFNEKSLWESEFPDDLAEGVHPLCWPGRNGSAKCWLWPLRVWPNGKAGKYTVKGRKLQIYHSTHFFFTLKWRYKAGGFVVSFPTIGTDGTIYFGSADSFLYAINPDGSLRWRYKAEDWVKPSPAIGADGTIYFGSGDHLYALNPDGTLKWKRETGTISSLAIGADGTIYLGSAYAFYVYAMNPDGSLKWQYDLEPTVWSCSSPAIGADGTIYFSAKFFDDLDVFYAISPDGSLQGEYDIGYLTEPFPVIGADGRVYFGSAGYLFAINPGGPPTWYLTKNGPLRWYITEAAVGLAIGADGTVYFSSGPYLCALETPDNTLGASPWPMFQHDAQHTGRAQ